MVSAAKVDARNRASQSHSGSRVTGSPVFLVSADEDTVKSV
jgi:hypothetical protein